MRADLRYLFASVAATAAFTFLALAFPNMTRAFTIPGAMVCFILTMYFIWPEIRDFHKNRRKRVIVLIGMIACAIGFSGFAAFYFWPAAEVPAGPSGPTAAHFSWTWEPLTAGEIEKISSQLRNSGGGNVTLAFNARTAGQLAASFTQIFERAEWTTNSVGPAAVIYTGGITGLGQYPNDTTGRSLKAAIESYSKLQVSFVGLRHVPGSGTSMLIIGAKPLPSPLPEC